MSFRFVVTEAGGGWKRIYDPRNDISRAGELLSEKDLKRMQTEPCNERMSLIQTGLTREGRKVVCRIPSNNIKTYS